MQMPPLFSRERSHLFDVDDVEHRVTGRLDPDEPGGGLPGRFERAGICEVNRCVVDPHRVKHLVHEPVSPAVGVVRDHEVITRPESPQECVLGRHPAREREPVCRSLECREGRLQRSSRRVARARVLEAGVLSDRLCANVELRWIGVTTAPVAGSGS